MLLNLFRTYLGSVKHLVRRDVRRTTLTGKERPKAPGLHRNLEALEDRTLLAAQLVTAGATDLAVSPGQMITIPVTYQTFDGTAAALGNPAALQLGSNLNVTFHYDSSQLTFNGFANVKTDDGLAPSTASNTEAAAGLPRNDDAQPGGADTDSLLQYSVGVIVNILDFPNPATDQEFKLFDAMFTVDPGFTAATTLNFVSQFDTQVKGGGTFEFAGQSITLNPTPSVTIAGTANGAEAGTPTNGSFTVAQSATTGTDTVVDFSVSGADDTTDFNIATAGNVTYDSGTNTGTVTIPSGSTSTAIPIVVLDDSLVEGTEAVSITLTGINSGDAVLGSTTNDSIDITDDDTATWSLALSGSPVTEGGSGSVTISLAGTLQENETAQVEIDVNDITTTSADYDDPSTAIGAAVAAYAGPGMLAVDMNGILTYTGGAGGTSMTNLVVSLGAVDDSFVEGDETFSTDLTNPASTTGASVALGTASVTATIDDNDTATWSISQSGSPATEGGSVDYTVSLTGSLQENEIARVEIDLTDIDTTSSDYADAVAAVTTAVGAYSGPGTLAFDGTSLLTYTGGAGGTSMADLVISLGISDDSLVEGTETFSVGLSSPSSTTGADVVLGAMSGVVTTITDNDTATIEVVSGSVTESGGAQNVTLRLVTGGATLQDNLSVSVNAAAAAGTEAGDATFGSLTGVTFNAGSGNGATQTTTFTPNGDTLVEGDEDATITPSGASLNGQVSYTANAVTITDADSASVAYQSSSGTAAESAGATNVTLVLTTVDDGGGSATLESAQSINVTATNGTAADADYDSGSFPKTVTFGASSGDGATQDTTIDPAEDTLVEGDQTVTLGLSQTGILSASGQTTNTFTITDDDSASVAYQSSSGTAAESAGATNVTLVLTTVDDGGGSATLESAQSINVTATNGTAADADYDSGSFPKTVTFGASSGDGSTQDTTIDPAADTLVEGDQTVTLGLSQTGILSASGQTTNTFTITDDDTASVAYQSSSGTAAESAGATNVTLVLTTVDDGGGSATLESMQSINVTATNGTAADADYDSGSFPKTVTFGASSGDGSTQDTTIDPAADTLVEGDQTVTLGLSQTGILSASGQTTNTFTITDDDSASVAYQSSSGTAAESAGATNVTLVLTTVDDGGGSATLESAQSINVTATNGTAADADYDSGSFPKSVTFGASSGDGSTQDTTIDPAADTLVEGDQTVTLGLLQTGILSASGQTTNTFTITDDDSASVAYQSSSGTAAESAGATNVTLVLTTVDDGGGSATLESAQSINVTATNGTADNSDYDSGSFPKTVTFGATSADGATQDTTVDPTEDNIVEGDQTVTLGLSQTGILSAAGQTTNTFTISDNDTAVFTVEDESGTENGATDSDNGTITFTVTSSNPIDTSVDIDVSFSDGSATGGGTDFVSTTQTISFPVNNQSQMVTVTLNNDTMVEGSETFGAALALATGQSLGNRDFNTADTATGTITDNDTAVFSFDSASSSVAENTPGTIDVDVNLLVTANGVANSGTLAGPLSVSVDDLQDGTAIRSPLASADYSGTSDPEVLTFNASGTQSVTLTIVNDGDQESNETINLSLISPTSPATVDAGADSHTVTILDDDTPQISVAALGGSSSVAENSGSNLVYRFTRDGDDSTVLSVNFSVSGNASTGDFTVDDSPTEVTFSGTTGTITFGSGVTMFDLNITPVGDTTVELNESVEVNVEAQTTGNVYNVGVPATGTGTITNDDSATISIGDVSVTEGGTLSFNVTIDNPVDVALTADRATADGTATTADSDYTALSSSNVTLFGAGSTTTFTIDVTTTGDSTVELDETLDVVLSNLATSGRSVQFDGSGSTLTGTGTITDNDTATFQINNVTANEDQGTMTFTVSVDNPLDIAVDIEVSYTDTTATGGGTDYDSTTDIASFAAGSTTSQMVTVAITDDNLVEEFVERFTASLAVASGTPVGARSVSTSDQGTGNIRDDDTATFSIDDVTVNEGDGTATFTVSLDKALDTNVDIDVSYGGGTASGSGTDYDSATDTVSFTSGSTTSQMVTVAITDDILVELTETFTASLAVNSGTDVGMRSVDVSDMGTGTINDNDTATFSIDDVTVNEGDGTATFTVSLDKALDTAVDIDVSYSGGTATGSGTDYDSATDTVSFGSGDNANKTVTVAITDDNLVELTETFTASLAIASGTPVGARSTSVIDTGTGTINDNDTATFSIDDVTVNEGDGTATFTVSLDKALDTAVDVEVSYSGGTATGSGTDYDSATDTVSFGSGDNANKTVTVAITDDNLVELTETFTASLAIASGTPVGARSTSVIDTGTGTINDNDTATFSIDDVTVNEGDGTATFTVSLDKALDTAVDIEVSYSGGTATGSGTDYDSATDTVSFGSGDNANKTVTVAITDDNLVELTETFTASLAIASGTPVGARSTSVIDAGTGTINDNDTATFSIDDVTVNEGDGTATFTVSLDKALDTAVDVEVSYSDVTATGSGTDYDSATDTVSFGSGDNANKTVTVAITDDNLVELTETFTASLAIASGTPVGARSTSVIDTGTGTINDNDTATFSIDDVTVNEGDGTATFTVSLDKALDTAVDIDVSYSGGTATGSGTDYDSATDTVSFGSGDNANKTVTVAITDDNLVELTETFTASLAIASGTPVGARSTSVIDTGTGTINDNDSATISISDPSVAEGGTLSFNVTIDNPVDVALTADRATADGTATTADSDYTAVSSSNVTLFGSGSTTTFTVDVSTTGDSTVELDETLNVILSNLATSGRNVQFDGGGSMLTGTGTITNDDSATISISDPSVTEGGTLSFNVTIDNPVDVALAANRATADGTATTADSDYTALSSSNVTLFGSGSTTTFTVDVSTTGDSTVELDETLDVVLSSLATSGRNVQFDGGGTTLTGTGTITNDDSATISISDPSVTEGGTLSFNVTIDNPVDVALTANRATADGTATTADSDYTALSSSNVTLFGAGSSTTFTIDVSTTGDSTVELDETLDVVLSSLATSGRSVQFNGGGSTLTGTGTITNNDSATISISDPSVTEGGTLSFNVTIDNPVDVAVTADRATADGTATTADSDYTALSSSNVTLFGAGSSTTFTIDVSTTGDSKVELDETLNVVLSSLAASSRDVQFNGSGSTLTGTGTITNDDSATISISATTDGDESGPVDGVFTVTQTAASSEASVIAYTVTGTATSGSDFTALSGTVTIAAGDTSATITVPVIDDVDGEDDETVIVTLDSVSNASDVTLDSGNSSDTVTIKDDDARRMSISVTPATVDELLGPDLVFTVTANQAVASDTVVNFNVSGDATFNVDYSVSGATSFSSTTGSVTILAGQTSADITVTPIDDMDIEGTLADPEEDVILTLIDNSVAYNLDPPIVATGGINDDEAVATPAIVDLTDNLDESVEVLIDAGSLVVRETTGAMTELFRRPAAQVVSLTINAGVTDSDTISINFVGGNPIPGVDAMITPSGGIFINGGTGGNDSLTLDNVGATFPTHTYDYANATDGVITLNDGAEDFTITFTGLEPVSNDGTADDITFNLPTTDDNASLADTGSASDGLMILSSSNTTFESTTFVVPTTSLTINGGDGNDTIAFASADDALVPNDPATTGSQTLTINGDAGADRLTGSATFNDIMNGGDGADVLNGRGGGDTLNGDAGNDTLLGGGGDDLLFGGDDNDRIKGQGGTDSVGGGGGNDTIEGGSGVSSLREEGDVDLTIRSAGSAIVLTGLGTDIITGTYTMVELIGGGSGNRLDASQFNGQVTLNGAGGDDTLIGTSNVDSIIGSDGIDRAIINVRGNVDVTDTGVFGPGGDFLDAVERIQIQIVDETGAHVDASGYTLGGVTVIGSGGRDTIIGSNQADFLNGRGSRDKIYGLDGNDRILGGGSADLLVGGAGRDTILGHAGIDTISGGTGNDRINGGTSRTVLEEEAISGNLTLASSGDTTTLSGAGIGNDKLTGSFQAVELTGDSGNNRIDASGFNFPVTLNGGDGNDTLLGGSAGDVLDGGNGTDQIQQTVDLEQTLNDTLVTGRGADTLSSIEEAVLIGGPLGTNIAAGAFTGNTTLIGNGGNDTLSGGSGDDVLAGGDGNDRIFAGVGADTADGAAGNDSLLGGAGNDILLGGTGSDTLRGEADNDSLIGEEGSDDVDGGTGTNTVSGGGNGVAAEGGDQVVIGDAGTINDTFMFDFDTLISAF